MHCVVVAPVFEFVAYSAAHLEMVGWCHGHIASVEQAVDVTAKKQPIARFMLALLGIRANMRSVQCGKSSLPRNCATAGIAISDNDAKSALPEAGANQRGFAPTRDRHIRCTTLCERAAMGSTGLNVRLGKLHSIKPSESSVL